KARFGGSRREDDNVISDGSVIAVADGQCMMIVDQGKIVDFCAEPGEYVFEQGGEPSIFYGPFNGEKMKAVLKTTFDRLSFGGQAGRDQRVYFFNTKEILGNKYGTPSPVPFRVVDGNIGLDVDISIRCFGEYSYRVTNPMLFYTHVCGNVEGDYTREQIDSQLKSELLTALQPAFAKISEKGVRYSALPGHTTEIAAALNDVLSEKWANLRGVEIVSFGINSVKASEEDEAMIKELQKNAVFRNANMAAAHLVCAQAQAMQDAAKNQGGAFTGFMGMNMAQQGGGINAAQLFQMARAAAGSAVERAGSAGRERLEVAPAARQPPSSSAQNAARKARTPARGRLDVFLRRGQHRQILFGMRREAPGRRAGLPLRQVRLAARRSGASAEILPGMRRFVRRE
ncbi:MAG: SPFH domain-containing protein, partial [Christensenellales bacterium]